MGLYTIKPEELLRFIHLGGVKIGNEVEIGALNSIARGTLNDTIIENGVKTDNLVHIAHNCYIGCNSLITACVELSGGVIVGKNVWIGPNSSVLEKIKIGDNAFIGIGSVVTKDVDTNMAGSWQSLTPNKTSIKSYIFFLFLFIKQYII